MGFQIGLRGGVVSVHQPGFVGAQSICKHPSSPSAAEGMKNIIGTRF